MRRSIFFNRFGSYPVSTAPPVIGNWWNCWAVLLPWYGPTSSFSHKIGFLRCALQTWTFMFAIAGDQVFRRSFAGPAKRQKGGH
jgi:hypothetical protein